MWSRWSTGTLSECPEYHYNPFTEGCRYQFAHSFAISYLATIVERGHSTWIVQTAHSTIIKIIQKRDVKDCFI